MVNKRKSLVSVLLILTLGFISIPHTSHADEWVDGYFRSNGTYVNGYYRSNPDGDPYNNYSYPGNYNPYTGKTATGNADTYLDNYYSKYDYSDYYTPSYSYSSSDDYTPSYSASSWPSYSDYSYTTPSYDSYNYSNYDDYSNSYDDYSSGYDW